MMNRSVQRGSSMNTRSCVSNVWWVSRSSRVVSIDISKPAYDDYLQPMSLPKADDEERDHQWTSVSVSGRCVRQHGGRHLSRACTRTCWLTLVRPTSSAFI